MICAMVLCSLCAWCAQCSSVAGDFLEAVAAREQLLALCILVQASTMNLNIMDPSDAVFKKMMDEMLSEAVGAIAAIDIVQHSKGLTKLGRLSLFDADLFFDVIKRCGNLANAVSTKTKMSCFFSTHGDQMKSRLTEAMIANATFRVNALLRQESVDLAQKLLKEGTLDSEMRGALTAVISFSKVIMKKEAGWNQAQQLASAYVVGLRNRMASRGKNITILNKTTRSRKMRCRGRK